MARCQCHFREVTHIPGGHNDPPAVGIRLDCLDGFGDLIDGLAICPTPTAPLMTIDRSEIAVCICPFIPDPYAVLLKVGYVRIPFQKPEQLMDDGFDMEFFGGHQGKPLSQVKTHLISESTDRAGSGTIILANALV